MALNNYSKTISNIMFWIENEKIVLRLYSIETGKMVNKEKGFKVKPNKTNITIDELISKTFGYFNKEKFLNFYNRYINSWINKTKDDFPMSIENIFKLSLLDTNKYNLDNIIKTYLNDNNKNDLNIIIENNKIIKQQDFNSYIDIVLSKFPDKVKEYKKGKLGLLNLFFGETIKSLPNKNIDKLKLRKDIELKLK